MKKAYLLCCLIPIADFIVELYTTTGDNLLLQRNDDVTKICVRHTKSMVVHHRYVAPLPQCKSCRVRTARSCLIRKLRIAPNTFLKSYQLVDLYFIVRRQASPYIIFCKWHRSQNLKNSLRAHWTKIATHGCPGLTIYKKVFNIYQLCTPKSN
jgi:hypothetical protein